MRDISHTLESPERQAFLPMTLIRSGGLPLSAWNAFSTGMPDWVAFHELQVRKRANLYELLDNLLQSLPEGDLRTKVYNARKAIFKGKNISPAIRKQFPEVGDGWTELSQGLKEWDALLQFRNTCEKDFDTAMMAGFRELRQTAKDSIIIMGLLYASHDLRERLDELSGKEPTEWDKRDEKVAMALFQYFTRTVFKTSPLSVFTTLAVQSFAGEDRERVGDWFDSRSVVTPNVAILPFVYDVLLDDSGFRNSLTVRINPSARYFSTGVYEWLYYDGTTEAIQQLSQQPLVDYLWGLLSGLEKAPSFAQLSNLLESESEESGEAVRDWLLRLVDIGFLEWIWPEKGLGPGWCGSLYQYLGYLPSSDTVTATAYLLQWLRTTARTLPFQAPEIVCEVQQEALVQLRSYFAPFGVEMPAIPVEQIFYEDVFREVRRAVPGDVLEQMITDLNNCWQASSSHLLPDFRADLVHFARKELGVNDRISFLDFCRRFMNSNAGGRIGPVYAPGYHGKMGAVIQPYFEDGQYKAVVNGLYAGCGKMYARWWYQIAPQEAEHLKQWMQDSDATVAPFPFPGWSNVHFQPSMFSGRLEVPDGRLSPNSDWSLPIRELQVRLNEGGMPELWNPSTASPVVLYDLGLESPELLPPVRRILWYLGVPYVSVDALLPGDFGWEDWQGIRRRRRTISGALVLAREAWLIPGGQLAEIAAGDKTLAARISEWTLALHQWEVPRYFFGKFVDNHEKPQFYDLKSPISMVLFLRNIRLGQGDYLLTEMLPLPEQCLADRVQEYVLEWDSGRL